MGSCDPSVPALALRVKLGLECAIMSPEESTDRADPITRHLAQRLPQLRKAAGLSQADLGARMAELRPNWSRSTVVKLETYKRESLPISDLFALALIFGVPVWYLLVDLHTTTPVPIIEDVGVDPWSFVRWFIGDVSFHKPGEDPRWGEAVIPMSLVNGIGRLMQELDSAEELRALGVQEPGYPDRGLHEQDVADMNDRVRLDRIAALLTRLLERGFVLPRLSNYTIRRAKELGVTLPGGEA